jgi:hypothetical protein
VCHKLTDLAGPNVFRSYAFEVSPDEARAAARAERNQSPDRKPVHDKDVKDIKPKVEKKPLLPTLPDVIDLESDDDDLPDFETLLKDTKPPKEEKKPPKPVAEEEDEVSIPSSRASRH